MEKIDKMGKTLSNEGRQLFLQPKEVHMDNEEGSRLTDEATEIEQPLAYVLAAPLPEQDETYTYACIPTIIAGCAKDD